MSRLLLTLTLVLAALAPAAAQEWPTRTITLVVPFTPGGGVDISARLQAQALGEILGQNVIVENIGGGGGMTAGSASPMRPPDGYTFMIGNTGTHAYNQTLYKKPLYNSVTDFTPVGLISESPRILNARKDLPVNGLQEFIAWLKANQSQGAVRLRRRRLRHPPALRAVQSRDRGQRHPRAVPGRRTGDPGPARRAHRLHVRHHPDRRANGKAGRREADCGAIRTPGRHRAGGADLRRAGLGRRRGQRLERIFLPKGTPDAIVRKLNAAMNKSLENPALRQRLEELGLEIVSPERRTPEYLAKYLPEEIARWAKPIRAAGISAD